MDRNPLIFTPMTSRHTRLLLFVYISALLLGGLVSGTAFAQVSMYADPKARQVGDIITIVLAERTAAQRESAWQNKSDASAGAAASVAGGSLSGRFAADARFNIDAESRNESVQSDLLRGTITAQVVNVDPAGNMVILGERRISVNGETHLMRINGVVRPYDVAYDNTVLSNRIANADITYHREGGLVPKFNKPGVFAKIGAAAAIVAAIILAL